MNLVLASVPDVVNRCGYNPSLMKNGYNTNLAAEFHVLSVLHRLGVDANLTLGNKKSVDIAIIRGAGDAVTVDVKGLAGTTGWPVGQCGRREAQTLLGVG